MSGKRGGAYCAPSPYLKCYRGGAHCATKGGAHCAKK